MRAKPRICGLAVLFLLGGGALLGSPAARAEVEVGVMAGAKFYSTDGALSRDGLTDEQTALSHSGTFGLRLGFLPISRLALEAEIGISPTAMRGDLTFPSGVRLASAQVAVVPLRAHLLINIATGKVRPFVLLGGGGHLSAPLSPGIVRTDAKGVLHAGAGLAFDIRPSWGLRLDGRFLLAEGQSAVFTPEGEVLAAVFGRFGAAPPPAAPPPPAAAPPPEAAPPPATAPPPGIAPPAAVTPAPPTPPPAVPAPPAALDSDSDGVIDTVDRCPMHPGPAANMGCPIELSAPAVPVPSQSATEPPPAHKALAAAAKSISFEASSAILTASSLKELDQTVQILRDNPALKIEIAGHTDTSGDPQQNRQISQQRAEAVMKYLIDHGITADRLRAQGYGPDRPRTTNATPEGRAQNRRVEFNPLPAK